MRRLNGPLGADVHNDIVGCNGEESNGEDEDEDEDSIDAEIGFGLV